MSDTTTIGLDEPGITRIDICTVAAARRVAAMLDLDPDAVREGDALPRGWQFILLGADTRRSALRQDGFPGLGVPLPDLGLPRLMLGGRTVRFGGDIMIGTTLRRVSCIAKLSRKDGANGPMAVVTLAHDLFQAGATAPVLVETQTYLLLGPQPTSQKPTTAAAVPPLEHTKHVVPDDTLLFQYSALGFNSHLIHLDRGYARDVEGFPDLVVNGGLATLLLTEFLRTDVGVIPVAIATRHLRPLFCNRRMQLGADRHSDAWLLRAFDDAGHVAIEITAEVA